MRACVDQRVFSLKAIAVVLHQNSIPSAKSNWRCKASDGPVQVHRQGFGTPRRFAYAMIGCKQLRYSTCVIKVELGAAGLQHRVRFSDKPGTIPDPDPESGQSWTIACSCIGMQLVWKARVNT